MAFYELGSKIMEKMPPKIYKLLVACSKILLANKFQTRIEVGLRLRSK